MTGLKASASKSILSLPSFPLLYRVPADASPLRLDAALSGLLPGFGLRARRRLWNACRISVNGRRLPPGTQVQGGDLLRVEWADPTPESSEAQSAETEAGLVRIVAGSANYMIFDKPSGLHSAHIRGSFAPSLEDLLQTWPDLPPGFRLLSRLDRETSGLVPGALSAEAEETFRLAERAGQVRKIYLGMAVGRIREPLLLRGRIRTDRRSGSLVLDEEDPDPVRHSAVFPLLHLPAALAGGEKGDEVTLARVEIRRGARHQIRAHLARAGHPLLGDIFYGARARELIEGGPQFFLHHTRIALPGLEAESPPPWLSRFAPDFAGIGAGNFLSR